jgi:hypothetical protein
MHAVLIHIAPVMLNHVFDFNLQLQITARFDEWLMHEYTDWYLILKLLLIPSDI